jgi:UDP-glucose 4-epimerase
VVPRFFEAGLTGEPLTVYGDGRQRRSFCHVSDIAGGIMAVQRRGLANEVYNVGNRDNITTILQLADRIRGLCGMGSPVQFVDPRELFGPAYIEAFDKIPDVGKAAVHTGWTPQVKLADALDRVHLHYRSRQDTAAVV